MCFKSTLSKTAKMWDILCIIVFSIFMVISTIFSAVNLINGLKSRVC